MSWLDKIVPSMGRIQRKDRRASVPDGLWRKCPKCEAVLYLPELEKHHSVCPKCEHHLRLTARKRLDWFLDKQGREEIAAEIEPNDRLKFRDSKKYKDRLSAAQKQTSEKDALVAMRGALSTHGHVMTHDHMRPRFALGVVAHESRRKSQRSA